MTISKIIYIIKLRTLIMGVFMDTSREARIGLLLGPHYVRLAASAGFAFGFLESSDLKLFENLISVSGIGPKTAMNIFSIGTRSKIVSAIISADTSFFKSVPRLGQKNAQKII